MSEEKKLPEQSLQASLIVCILLNTLVTIVKEICHPVKAFITQIFGNHWVGHMVLLVLLFLLLVILFKTIKINPSFNFNRALRFSIILSVILLVLFYCTKYSLHTD